MTLLLNPSSQVLQEASSMYYPSLSNCKAFAGCLDNPLESRPLTGGGLSCRRLRCWQVKGFLFPPLGKHRATRYVNVLSMDIPDFLPSAWTKDREEKKPVGPSVQLSAEQAVERQLQVLRNNDTPRPDHGVEVMYSFAGFDPFQRSRYFGQVYDLGQFERFRRIFHHSSYRVLLNHQEHVVLSSFYPSERVFKQRVWVLGARPGEEETFEFTLTQRLGGHWDGYWLTESLVYDNPAKEDD